MRSRSYIVAASVVSLAAIAIWLFAIFYWEHGASSAREIRLTDPPATMVSTVATGDRFTLEGKNAKHCVPHREGLGSVDTSGTFDLLTEFPKPSYGERLVWVGFECMDGTSTRFARTAIPSESQSMLQGQSVEVARVGMDFRRIESWMEDQLKDIVYRSLKEEFEYTGKYKDGSDCPRLPRRSENGFLPKGSYFRHPIKCGIKYPGIDKYVMFSAIGEPNISINVSDGFAVDILLTIQRQIRETDCFLRTCGKDEYISATINWRVKVAAVETTQDPEEPVRLVFNTSGDSDVDTGNFLLNSLADITVFLFPRMKRLAIERIDEAFESLMQKQVRNITRWFRDRMSGELLVFLTRDSEIAKRIASTVGASGRLDLSRVDVQRSGETLSFSLMAPADWARTTGPTLDVGGVGEDFSLNISYALINGLLAEILDDAELSDILEELKKMLRLVGVEVPGVVDEFESDVDAFARDWDPFLNYAELQFDRSLGFALPLRIRPVSEQEVRVFFAHAEVLTTSRSRDANGDAAARSTVPIGLSFEGRVLFNRVSNEEDVAFLLDHIALEPLVSDKGTGDDTVGLYYGLTPLFRKVVNWESAGDLEEEDFGKGFAKLRSAPLTMLELVSLKDHFPFEIELYTTAPPGAKELSPRATVATINFVRNDAGQNSLVADGKLGYSHAGAVYVSQNDDYWAVAHNCPYKQMAAQAAMAMCQRRGGKCFEDLVFHRAEVAVARSSDGRYFFGKGADGELAKAAARSKCSRAGREGCEVRKDSTWSNTRSSACLAQSVRD